jgi:hypothetical protein
LLPTAGSTFLRRVEASYGSRGVAVHDIVSVAWFSRVGVTTVILSGQQPPTDYCDHRSQPQLLGSAPIALSVPATDAARGERVALGGEVLRVGGDAGVSFAIARVSRG